jgi:hypothetical protein
MLQVPGGVFSVGGVRVRVRVSNGDPFASTEDPLRYHDPVSLRRWGITTPTRPGLPCSYSVVVV